MRYGFRPTAFFIPLLLHISCEMRQSGEANNRKAMNDGQEERGFASKRKVEMNPSSEPLSADESLERFRLPAGYRLEIVASEPMISEPAAITWDGNGRMYVAQLETYMQTIDAKNQDEPRSRIMRLEDTDNDGRMDKSSVFADSLLSPRMLLCVGDELLVNETNTFDIHAYKDHDGDGRADSKRTVYSKKTKAYGNVEHQRTGLDWNIDNRIYVTTDLITFRYKNKKLIADSLAYGNNGQWGLTHDDYGRIFFSRAASGTAASGFQVNPVYGQLDIFDPYEDSVFRLVWPGVKTPDANDRLRADSTLVRFTSVCGQSVYRGDRLPASMQGDYFATEPVGRIVRRAKIFEEDGVIKLKNAYHEDEFITTSDMNFRPVNTYSGPDGCLYIVDMYRGIIQEATWVQPGMPIYDQVKSKRLDRNIRRGRIYRLVHDKTERGPKPTILDATSAQLVTYLQHPNGWWRDNAQKELIVRNDLSVVPALKQLFHNSTTGEIPRLHALWTIDGLDAIDNRTTIAALQDNSPQIRKAGIRLSEKYLLKKDRQVVKALLSTQNDASKEVIMQLVLSLHTHREETTDEIVRDILIRYKNDKLLSGIREMFVRNQEMTKFGSRLVALDEPARKLVTKGSLIFNSLCASCHGPRGEGLPAAIAPPLIGKFKLIANKEGVIKILLNGLAGPVDGISYPDVMMPMKSYGDEWIASVLSYVRFDLCMQSFPNMPSDYLNWVIVRPDDVNKIRSRNSAREKPWTWEELMQKKN